MYTGIIAKIDIKYLINYSFLLIYKHLHSMRNWQSNSRCAFQSEHFIFVRSNEFNEILRKLFVGFIKVFTVAIYVSPLPVDRVSSCITLTTKWPLFRWGCFRYNSAFDSDVLVNTEHLRTIFWPRSLGLQVRFKSTRVRTQARKIT